MMYWIVNWSVKFRRIVMALAAGLLIFGLLQIDDVKQDILPEFSPTTVEVQTEALGLSAAEVEQLITVPLEQDLLNGVAFLDTIESASLPGLSSVVMKFEPGTDLLDARQVVAERLTQAAGLPQVADPPQMIQPLSSSSRVAMASLNSTELTPIEISVLARWVMVPRLLGVEGVANVSIWGFRDQQLQVLVDPVKLADQNVSLSQVISTAGNALEVSPLSFLEASSPGTGGFIDTVNQRLHVFHEQAISTPEQLAQVTVEGPEGGAIFINGEALALGDVAELVTDHQPLIGDAYCSGGPCILLVIEKFPEANTPEVASGVESALEALSLGLPGMEIDTSVYRPAAFIDASVSNLRGTVIVGLLLLVIALAVLFLSWRIVLISAVSIVSSLVAAGLILLLFDRTVNTMILAGLVVALIVIIDDAVVGAWGTAEGARVRDVERTRVEPAIVDSVLRFRAVALYSAVIVAAAMLPVIALEGEAGAFLEPMALAYLLAIGAAMFVGLTVAPALSVFLLANGSPETQESPLGNRLREWYRGFGPRSVPRLRIALAVYGLAIVAGLIAVTSLSQSLAPSPKERDLLIQLEAAPGTSLPRMDDITARMVDELHAQPGVGSIAAHIGRAIMSDQIVSVNSAEIWVNIDPSADYEEAIRGIESVVEGHAEVVSQIQTYSDQRIAAILGGPTDEVIVRVYGTDPAIRQSMAEQVQEVMVNVDGIDEAIIDVQLEEATLEIEVDLQQAQAFGVRPGDVRRQAATLVSGLVVGNLFEDQKVFDVVVWGVPEIRQTVDDIATLPIATPSGEHVPLGLVANVQIIDNPTIIRHESVSTYLDVLAPVSRRTPDAAAADIDRALAGIQFPLEHRVEVLGSFTDVRAARTRAVTAGIAAVILVYLLLQSAFASWRLASLAFLALPMGVSGSFVAIALAGGEASLGSIAGIAAVLALTTRVVVLMFRSFQRRERAGEPFGQDLIIGEATRLVVPSATSAVAIAAVLVPLLLAGSRAGLEIAGPTAVAVLGGLVTTALLTVAVMPALYLRWGYVAHPDTYADDLFAPDLLPAVDVGG
jgi:Cu/Ag efflux pump CusA